MTMYLIASVQPCISCTQICVLHLPLVASQSPVARSAFIHGHRCDILAPFAHWQNSQRFAIETAITSLHAECRVDCMYYAYRFVCRWWERPVLCAVHLTACDLLARCHLLGCTPHPRGHGPLLRHMT